MNIVYLLVNNTKTKGKRFYVGSKTECNIVELDGINTIIDLKSDKPYYSSSQSLEMKEDMLKGDVFVASILESVPDRRNLLERENYWINKYDAVFSQDFYNITNAVLNCHDQEVIVNVYGERLKELATRNSSLSKKDNTAKKLGYDNFAQLVLYIWQESEIKTYAEISKDLGKERHFAKIFVRGYDKAKTLTDLQRVDLQPKLRKMVLKGCSLFLASQKLKLEYPAARILLGDFNKLNERSYSVAKLGGLSKKELEVQITKDILDGAGFREVATKYGIIYESVKRYFFRCVRERLKSSDL